MMQKRNCPPQSAIYLSVFLLCIAATSYQCFAKVGLEFFRNGNWIGFGRSQYMVTSKELLSIAAEILILKTELLLSQRIA